MRKRFTRSSAAWLASVLLAFALGAAMQPRPATTAEIQQPKSPERFLAGDERSIPVLQEIAATAKQIDARLERMEKWLDAQRKP